MALPASLMQLSDYVTRPATTLADLTPRQWHLAMLVRDDLTNAEIARRWGVTEGTVKHQMTLLLYRTGCASRVGVALWVARQEWQAELDARLCEHATNHKRMVHLAGVCAMVRHVLLGETERN